MIYAVADFHGNINAWNNFKSALGKNDHCIVLGDACDRGVGGVQILREIRKDSRFTYILGNHDDFVLRTFRPDLVFSKIHTSKWGKNCWLYNYKPSIGEWEDLKRRAPKEFADFLDWLASRKVCMKVWANDTLYRLAHAKYPKNQTFSQTTWKEMEQYHPDLLFATLWDRYCTDDLSHYIEENTVSLVGHTPIPNKNPCIVKDHLYNLDGGLGDKNDVITVFCLSNGKMYYVREDTILPHSNDPLKIVMDLDLLFYREQQNPNSVCYSSYKKARKELKGALEAVGSSKDYVRWFVKTTIHTSEIIETRVFGMTELLFTKNSIYQVF